MSVDLASAQPSRPSPGAAGARLGELYAAHARMVYGICRMLLRNVEEAEDATQQVFLSAYRSLLTGIEVRDSAAWLGTIARNACRRRANERMREPLATSDQPTLVTPAADETAIGREEAWAVYAQLAVLPVKQREAVVLRDVYGLRYDEVAKALGTSRPAVEALLFRGRRQLQRRLRPGVAAGVLAVPLAIQESIAYAVPGFAATAAAPVGAAAAAAGIPLVAKLAAAGGAVALAGSAGAVADRVGDEPTARPLEASTQKAEPVGRAAAEPPPPELLSIPAGGLPVVTADKDDEASSASGSAGDDDRDVAGEDRSGPGGRDDPEPAGGDAVDDDGSGDDAGDSGSGDSGSGDSGSGHSGSGSDDDE